LILTIFFTIQIACQKFQKQKKLQNQKIKTKKEFKDQKPTPSFPIFLEENYKNIGKKFLFGVYFFS